MRCFCGILSFVLPNLVSYFDVRQMAILACGKYPHAFLVPVALISLEWKEFGPISPGVYQLLVPILF